MGEYSKAFVAFNAAFDGPLASAVVQLGAANETLHDRRGDFGSLRCPLDAELGASGGFVQSSRKDWVSDKRLPQQAVSKIQNQSLASRFCSACRSATRLSR
ncbi:hypothetical protein ACWGS9_32700, partial [Bradyrhizobium sp. Arg314]